MFFLAAQAYRFVQAFNIGNAVVTYDRGERIYLVENLKGNYKHTLAISVEQPNTRRVRWRGKVCRDLLSFGGRNSRSAISTLFLVPAEVATDIEFQLSGRPSPATPADISSVEQAADDLIDNLHKDIRSKGFEFINMMRRTGHRDADAAT